MGWVVVTSGQALRGMVCVSETSIDIFDADVELRNLTGAGTGAAGRVTQAVGRATVVATAKPTVSAPLDGCSQPTT